MAFARCRCALPARRVVAIAWDEHATCYPRSAVTPSPPNSAGGGQRRAVALCTAVVASRSCGTSTPRAFRALQPPSQAVLAEGRAERPHCFRRRRVAMASLTSSPSQLARPARWSPGRAE